MLSTGAGNQYLKINEQQRSVLEACFRDQFFPNKTTLEQLALQTGLKERQLSKWFTNRKCRLRQKKGEEQ